MPTFLSVRVTGKKAKVEMDHRRALRDAVDLIVRSVVTRTRGGRDIKGRFFKGYAPSIVGRAKSGGGGTYSGHVNLDDTGHMLGALRGRVTSRKKAVIEFADQEAAQKAVWHQKGTRRATGGKTKKGRARTSRRMPRREFLGVSKQVRKKVRGILGLSLSRWKF